MLPEHLLLEMQKKKPRKVPLYECDEFINDYRNPVPIERIELPSVVRAEFAILMPDDSMWPDYDEKDILFISKFSQNRHLPFLILYNDQTSVPRCNIRFVSEFKYNPEIELLSKKESFFVDKEFVQILGRVVWRKNR